MLLCMFMEEEISRHLQEDVASPTEGRSQNHKSFTKSKRNWSQVAQEASPTVQQAGEGKAWRLVLENLSRTTG